jgi:hypothetical protein
MMHVLRVLTASHSGCFGYVEFNRNGTLLLPLLSRIIHRSLEVLVIVGKFSSRMYGLLHIYFCGVDHQVGERQ